MLCASNIIKIIKKRKICKIETSSSSNGYDDCVTCWYTTGYKGAVSCSTNEQLNYFLANHLL